jgi:DNA-binding GntR family transcriptional regulator
MTVQVQAVSIVDAVAQDLRAKLFSGALTSSAQLTEADVAATYGVARPSAKAAIEKLVSEGLLLRGTHKTARVPSLTIEDVRDLYFTRTCIESEIARQLAILGRVPEGLTRVNRELRDAEPGSGLAIADPVTKFHVALANELNSPRVSRLFTSLMGEMRLCMAQMQYRQLLSATVIAEEHERIIVAIKSRSPERAAAAMSEHLDRACNRLLPVLEGEVQEARDRGSQEY